MSKNEQASLTFEDVALEEMEYVHRRSAFSKPNNAGAQGGDSDDEFAPTPSEVFAHLRANSSAASVRSIALDGTLPQLNGLSLSGGGIRSASFCLGVVEGLAELGVLNQFHYVSSVSGGGYTASWLAAWSYRVPDGIAGVQLTLREAAAKSEPLQEIQHLSRYVTYLAPRTGLLSADLWSLLSAYFRNLTITLGTVVPAVLLVAGAPIFLALFSVLASKHAALSGGAAALCALALIGISLSMRMLAEAPDFETAERNAVLARWLAPTALGIGGLTFAIAFCASGWLSELGSLGLLLNVQAFWIGVLTSLTLAGCLALHQLVRSYRAAEPSLRILLRLRVAFKGVEARWRHCISVPVSMVVALLILAALELIAQWFVDTMAFSGQLSTAFVAITVGPMIWCVAVVLGETTLQAVLSQQLDDGDREWMARFSGLCITAALIWLFLCLVTLFLTSTATAIGHWWVWLGLFLIVLLARILFPTRFPVAAVSVAATACLFALASGVSWLVHKQLNAGTTVEILLLHTFYSGIALIGVVFLLDWFVNINKFSMHALYRDRLVRTFLGASRHKNQDMADRGFPQDQESQFNKRVGSPFHDFDPSDNPQLSWLKSDASWRPNHWMPVFLFNASLNRTWYTRQRGRMAKAFSFSFSPFFCGSKLTDYCRTEDYVSKEGGFTLGAAIATSGAALSSRAGRFDNPLFAFFLTLINLRLGTWLGNPSNKETRILSGPQSSWKAYLSELFGGSSRRKNWLHLSDGGHFENLGTYELIRRGCKKIVAVDSSADPDRDFADLSNLIRLARDELNVVIRPVSNMRIGDRKLTQGLYASIFEIVYPEGASGRLIYIKPSIYDETRFAVPIEVQSYAKQSAAFPHESTMDQFFSAEQFDAYRRLGLHQVRTIFDDGLAGRTYHLGELFDLADDHTSVKQAPDLAESVTLAVVRAMTEANRAASDLKAQAQAASRPV